MNDALRRAIVAAGYDPDKVAEEARTVSLTDVPPRESLPVQSLDEQLGLEGVDESQGILTIRPGTKRHASLERCRGDVLETTEVEFLQDFIAAGLVQGSFQNGWTTSPRGDMALGVLDYGSLAKCEKGKPVSAHSLGRDERGLAQREGQSATSKAAAERVIPITGKSRLAVLACIHVKGGATDEEVEVALGMNPSTVRPRRVELVQAEAVVDSGTTRKTSSGHTAVVWTTTPFGAEAAAEHLARLAAR